MQTIATGIHTMLAPFAAAAPGASLTPLDIAYATRTLADLRDLTTLYDLYWDYYRGRQRDPNGELTDRTARDFAAAHNFAGRAIKIIAGRLKVQGFDAVNAAQAGQDQLVTSAGESALTRTLARWDALNGMDQMQLGLHARALAQGDVYVNVGWDAVRDIPLYRLHTATEITPVYEDGVLVAAYKLWTQTYRERDAVQERYRLTKYTASRIEKWYVDGLGGTWQRWTQDRDAAGNPDGGVVDWTDARGRPLGIPIVHFRNKAQGEDFGYSEIADLIAPQDSLNKRIAALDEAAGYQGAAQWWALDVDTEALRKSPPAIGPGMLLLLQSLNGKDKAGSVGHFPPGDVANLAAAVVTQIKVLAALATTPVHLLFPEGGVPPSGESLKTAEAGLIGTVEDAQVELGAAHAAVRQMGMRLHNTFSRGARLPEDVLLTTLWRPAAIRSELTDAQVTALRGEDWSWAERLRRDGYTDAEIASIKAERDEETPPALRAIDQQIGQQARQMMAGPGGSDAAN